MQTMKAVRLTQVGSPLELHEIPIPELGHGEALVQVKAAGICHSDAHYRAGTSPVEPLPLTLGHEIAGIVVQTAPDVTRVSPGQAVCVHYLATCGECEYCLKGIEQFCVHGQMVGKHRNGGYAQYVAVPARSLFPLPQDISFAHGAVLMCSSATSLHALSKARLRPGETVAIFGAGGLGISAVQLAFAFGAARVFAIDLQENKRQLAQRFGAEVINPARGDSAEQIRSLTAGLGVNVALELVGSPVTARQALRCLAIQGRVALVGLTKMPFEAYPYSELINREAEIIGISDHLAQEIPMLLQFVRQGKLDLNPVVTRAIPLDADKINSVLDDLDRFGQEIRLVIQPD